MASSVKGYPQSQMLAWQVALWWAAGMETPHPAESERFWLRDFSWWRWVGRWWVDGNTCCKTAIEKRGKQSFKYITSCTPIVERRASWSSYRDSHRLFSKSGEVPLFYYIYISFIHFSPKQLQTYTYEPQHTDAHKHRIHPNGPPTCSYPYLQCLHYCSPHGLKLYHLVFLCCPCTFNI